MYENQGKTSGAYSAGQEFIHMCFLNYKDTLNCMFTLAHEMGHAIHSYLSNKNQPVVYSDYVIFCGRGCVNLQRSIAYAVSA